jgi:hypothetical protein
MINMQTLPLHFMANAPFALPALSSDQALLKRISERVEKKQAAMTTAQRRESQARARALFQSPSPAAAIASKAKLAAEYLERARTRATAGAPAAAARPLSRMAVLRAEVAKIEEEIAACDSYGDRSKKWKLGERLTAAQARLENFEGVPESELREMMANTTDPRELYFIAAALNAAM